jgi:hypothetical protein
LIFRYITVKTIIVPCHSDRSPQGVTVQGHSDRSPQRVTVPGDSDRSPQLVTVQGHSDRSPQRVTVPGHSDRSPQHVTVPGHSDRSLQRVAVQSHSDRSPYRDTQTHYADSCQPVVAVTSRFRVIDGEVVTKCQLICLSHSRRAHLQSEHLCNLLSWTIIKYNWYLGKDSWGKKEKQAWYISYCRCDLRRGKLSLKKIKKKKVNNALSFHRKNLFCNNTSKRRQYNSIDIMVDCYLTSNGCISPVFMDRYTTTVTRRCHKRSWINLPFQSTCVHVNKAGSTYPSRALVFIQTIHLVGKQRVALGWA